MNDPARGYIDRPISLYEYADNSRFEAGATTIGNWLNHLRGKDARTSNHPLQEEERHPQGDETAATTAEYRRLLDNASGIDRNTPFGKAARGERRRVLRLLEIRQRASRNTRGAGSSGAASSPTGSTGPGVVHFDSDHVTRRPAPATTCSLLRSSPTLRQRSGAGVHFGVLPSRNPSSPWEYQFIWLFIQRRLQQEGLLPKDAAELRKASDQQVKDPARLRFFAHDPTSASAPMRKSNESTFRNPKSSGPRRKKSRRRSTAHGPHPRSTSSANWRKKGCREGARTLRQRPRKTLREDRTPPPRSRGAETGTTPHGTSPGGRATAGQPTLTWKNARLAFLDTGRTQFEFDRLVSGARKNGMDHDAGQDRRRIHSLRPDEEIIDRSAPTKSSPPAILKTKTHH